MFAKTVCGIVRAPPRGRSGRAAALAVSHFQPGAALPATIRFSNASGVAQIDPAPDVRGLAVRLHLPGGAIHDLLMANHPTAFVRDARQLMALLIASLGRARDQAGATRLRAWRAGRAQDRGGDARWPQALREPRRGAILVRRLFSLGRSPGAFRVSADGSGRAAGTFPPAMATGCGSTSPRALLPATCISGWRCSPMPTRDSRPSRTRPPHGTPRLSRSPRSSSRNRTYSTQADLRRSPMSTACASTPATPRPHSGRWAASTGCWACCTRPASWIDGACPLDRAHSCKGKRCSATSLKIGRPSANYHCGRPQGRKCRGQPWPGTAAGDRSDRPRVATPGRSN